MKIAMNLGRGADASVLSHSSVGICTERDGKRCSKGHKW